MNERDSFKSRLGFLLVSAGCAIGIGNVWKFPYVTGEYGGAVFVLGAGDLVALLGVQAELFPAAGLDDNGQGRELVRLCELMRHGYAARGSGLRNGTLVVGAV